MYKISSEPGCESRCASEVFSISIAAAWIAGQRKDGMEVSDLKTSQPYAVYLFLEIVQICIDAPGEHASQLCQYLEQKVLRFLSGFYRFIKDLYVHQHSGTLQHRIRPRVPLSTSLAYQ